MLVALTRTPDSLHCAFPLNNVALISKATPRALPSSAKKYFLTLWCTFYRLTFFFVVNAGQGAAAAGCAQHHQERTGPPASGTRTSHAHCKRNSELQLAQSGMCSAFFSQQPTAFCSSREQLSNIYINLVPDAARDTSRGSHHFDTSL